MKKINLILSAVVICIGMAACGEAQVDQSALNSEVEKRSAVLISDANTEYETNCEARMSTEVKEKTDSIINAKKVAGAAQ